MKIKKPEKEKKKRKYKKLKLEDRNLRGVCGFRISGGKRKELVARS